MPLSLTVTAPSTEDQEPESTTLTSELAISALKEGSLVNLSLLTGYKETQFSAWFAGKRKISDRVYVRLGEQLGLQARTVRKAVIYRQKRTRRQVDVNVQLRAIANRRRNATQKNAPRATNS